MKIDILKRNNNRTLKSYNLNPGISNRNKNQQSDSLLLIFFSYLELLAKNKEAMIGQYDIFQVQHDLGSLELKGSNQQLSRLTPNMTLNCSSSLTLGLLEPQIEQYEPYRALNFIFADCIISTQIFFYTNILNFLKVSRGQNNQISEEECSHTARLA